MHQSESAASFNDDSMRMQTDSGTQASSDTSTSNPGQGGDQLSNEELVGDHQQLNEPQPMDATLPQLLAQFGVNDKVTKGLQQEFLDLLDFCNSGAQNPIPSSTPVWHPSEIDTRLSESFFGPSGMFAAGGDSFNSFDATWEDGWGTFPLDDASSGVNTAPSAQPLAPAQDDMVTDDPRSEPAPTQPIADNNTSADFSMSDNGNEDLVESFSTQPFEQNRINDSVNSGENQWTYENANTSNSISWTPGTYGHFGPNDFDPMDFVDLEAAQLLEEANPVWMSNDRFDETLQRVRSLPRHQPDDNGNLQCEHGLPTALIEFIYDVCTPTEMVLLGKGLVAQGQTYLRKELLDIFSTPNMTAMQEDSANPPASNPEYQEQEDSEMHTAESADGCNNLSIIHEAAVAEDQCMSDETPTTSASPPLSPLVSSSVDPATVPLPPSPPSSPASSVASLPDDTPETSIPSESQAEAPLQLAEEVSGPSAPEEIIKGLSAEDTVPYEAAPIPEASPAVPPVSDLPQDSSSQCLPSSMSGNMLGTNDTVPLLEPLSPVSSPSPSTSGLKLGAATTEQSVDEYQPDAACASATAVKSDTAATDIHAEHQASSLSPGTQESSSVLSSRAASKSTFGFLSDPMTAQTDTIGCTSKGNTKPFSPDPMSLGLRDETNSDTESVASLEESDSGSDVPHEAENQAFSPSDGEKAPEKPKTEAEIKLEEELMNVIDALARMALSSRPDEDTVKEGAAQGQVTTTPPLVSSPLSQISEQVGAPTPACSVGITLPPEEEVPESVVVDNIPFPAATLSSTVAPTPSEEPEAVQEAAQDPEPAFSPLNVLTPLGALEDLPDDEDDTVSRYQVPNDIGGGLSLEEYERLLTSTEPEGAVAPAPKFEPIEVAPEDDPVERAAPITVPEYTPIQSLYGSPVVMPPTGCWPSGDRHTTSCGTEANLATPQAPEVLADADVSMELLSVGGSVADPAAVEDFGGDSPMSDSFESTVDLQSDEESMDVDEEGTLSCLATLMDIDGDAVSGLTSLLGSVPRMVETSFDVVMEVENAFVAASSPIEVCRSNTREGGTSAEVPVDAEKPQIRELEVKALPEEWLALFGQSPGPRFTECIPRRPLEPRPQVPPARVIHYQRYSKLPDHTRLRGQQPSPLNPPLPFPDRAPMPPTRPKASVQPSKVKAPIPQPKRKGPAPPPTHKDKTSVLPQKPQKVVEKDPPREDDTKGDREESSSCITSSMRYVIGGVVGASVLVSLLGLM
ncbi:hypothetical protein D9619_007915 [Psilocybe cf. subviscida]|uniref:Uncharacterized protein n=1 Tax=Psilocybe cf. subviscida TaxID=2480587 RepID=A0A8H5ATA6_9AGAR|nr:hypothetical protein D9619_007915 [Psilocybe cf. subviscida]